MLRLHAQLLYIAELLKTPKVVVEALPDILFPLLVLFSPFLLLPSIMAFGSQHGDIPPQNYQQFMTNAQVVNNGRITNVAGNATIYDTSRAERHGKRVMKSIRNTQ